MKVNKMSDSAMLDVQDRFGRQGLPVSPEGRGEPDPKQIIADLAAQNVKYEAALLFALRYCKQQWGGGNLHVYHQPLFQKLEEVLGVR
jgi:hypothetical protein